MCSGNGFTALQYVNIQVMEVSPRSLIPSPSAVKSQSLETVVHLPPQLHCLSILSVTPAPTPSYLVPRQIGFAQTREMIGSRASVTLKEDWSSFG